MLALKKSEVVGKEELCTTGVEQPLRCFTLLKLLFV